MTQYTGEQLSELPDEAEVEIYCTRCQLSVWVGRWGDKVLPLSHHMDKAHPGEFVVAFGGDDWRVSTPPWRCDLCGALAEPPWWDYVTPPAPGFTPEDPRWLVCDPCQRIVERFRVSRASEQRTALQLARRTRAYQMEQFGATPGLDQLLPFVLAFLRHIEGEPTRESA